MSDWKRRTFLGGFGALAAGALAACDDVASTDSRAGVSANPGASSPSAETQTLAPFEIVEVVDVPSAKLADGCTVSVRGELMECVSPTGDVLWTRTVGHDAELVSVTHVVARGAQSLALDASRGTIAVLNEGGEVVETLPRGERFHALSDACVLPDGDLVVCDVAEQRVTRIGADGRARDILRAPADGSGAWNGPSAVAFDGETLWVSDLGGDRVVNVSLDGRLLGSIGDRDELTRPRGVAVDDAGRVYVASPVLGAVLLYEAGQVVDRFSAQRADGTPAAPWRVSLLPSGELSIHAT